MFNIIFECGTLCRMHVGLNVWHENGRSNVTVHLGRQQCARMPSLLSPWHALSWYRRTSVRPPDDIEKSVTQRLHCPATWLSKQSISCNVVKLAFSLRRHIRRTLAIIQSESTTHGTSLTSNGSSVDAAGGRRKINSR